MEGGHNSPPHVFFHHVEWNAAGSDTYRVLPYLVGEPARMEYGMGAENWKMRRLQVDLIIFALEQRPGYRDAHTSFICKMNPHL